MKIVNIHQAKDEIEQLVNQTNDNHQPILLSGTKGNAVLVAEDDWNAIQETLYLYSIPGRVESIIEGGNTEAKDCLNEESIFELQKEETIIINNDRPVVKISQCEISPTTDDLFKDMRGKIQYFEDLTTPTLEEWQEV